MDPRLRNRLAAGVILAAVLAFAFRVQRDMVDFTVNYKAGDRLLHGETLYRIEDGHYQFKYSPFCAILYLPLSLLPLAAAKGVWFGVVLGAMAVMIVLTRRLIGPSPPDGFRAAAALPPLVLARFFFRELDLGQINAVLTAILLGMILLLARDEERRNRRKSALAGVLWGTAVAMKPYAAIFLPYFLLKKKWNALWPGLLILALSLVAPAMFYGFPGSLSVHLEWIGTLSKSTPGLLSAQDNVSILAFLMKWTRNIEVSRLVYGGILLVLAFAVLAFILRGRRRAGSLTAEASLLLLAIPLISPLGWDYTFIASLPAVALVFARFRSFPPIVRVVLAVNFAVIGLSAFDLLGRDLFAGFMTASILTLNFLLLGAGLFHLRFSGNA